MMGIKREDCLLKELINKEERGVTIDLFEYLEKNE